VTAEALDEVLLDTDALSFAFNEDPVRMPRYAALTRGKIAKISFVTAAELRYGAVLRGWGPRRRAKLEAFLARYHPVESTPSIGELWGIVRVESMKKGRAIERQDAWIAATALALGIPLVTHNAKHYSHLTGLQIVTEPD
jgi:predicted nucleic acid-binding protein